MESTHESLMKMFEEYLVEHEKFTVKGNKSAGTRARKALMDITKACKERRQEIQDSKNAE
mgnify:CR=1 FL=1|jgi:hypothetical protein